jgi:formate dehydrogenase major subunit
MSFSRRDWLRGAAILPTLAATKAVDAEVAEKTGKLDGSTTFTTACNFCSCGCGMVGQVKDGKLINLEGDPDHAINQGALCSKGAAMFATHESDQRVRTPMYRAAGSDKWTQIGWDEALEKIARKVQQVRDANWIATDKDGEVEVPANRTDAIGFLGGAQNTNEECYLYAKMARLLGTPYVEHQARL